ncbi:uncharacterized protein METZ01_LOCUS457571 [marine metagenome]|uniref:Uncharacterized protein n=1 Tax=marine metagenome TaxID=408172 RepID=A0A383AA73_9ZZZZ
MSYFNNFPTIMYDPTGDGSAKLATNIMKRVRMRANMKKEVIMMDPYDVKENETPEIVADKHHGSPYYHWVIMLLNDISDVNHDWVKSTRQLQKYLLSKYTEIELTETHHYEIPQTSGDTSINIEVENTTYPSASIVTNYEYEVAINDEKRSIDLLRNEYLGFFEDEFQSLI